LGSKKKEEQEGGSLRLNQLQRSLRR
jgi:hypothetical protein